MGSMGENENDNALRLAPVGQKSFAAILLKDRGTKMDRRYSNGFSRQLLVYNLL